MLRFCGFPRVFLRLRPESFYVSGRALLFFDCVFSKASIKN